MEGVVEVNTCNTYFPESYYILRETTSSSDARSRSMKWDIWSSRQSAPPPVQHGTMVEYSCPYKRETQGKNIRWWQDRVLHACFDLMYLLSLSLQKNIKKPRDGAALKISRPQISWEIKIASWLGPARDEYSTSSPVHWCRPAAALASNYVNSLHSTHSNSADAKAR
jgi:hypothetical protein